MTETDGQDNARVIAGRYRLRRHIGGGAMGVVWEATDELLDRTVAVKQLLIPPQLTPAEAEQARKRSFREARLAARLQHPHAITVFDVADDDGKPVLVMEYLPSHSLAEVLAERGSLPPAEVARIGAHAASALAAAHAAGIVHRDVKPGNILLGADGIAKITDFGISKAADDGTLTGSGRFAGTPAFLAPETARGEQPGPESDVYSLGATLYAAVEGRMPYGDTDNQMALLYAAAAGRVAPPEHAGPLTGVLDRILQVDPAARPTMAELASELGKLALLAAPTKADTAPPKKTSRRRFAFAGAVLAGVAALAVALVILLPDWAGSGAAPNPTSSAAPPPSPTTTTVTETASHSSTPSANPSSATSSPASAVQAVSDYYALMPRDTDAGWERLGPVLRAQGKAAYVRFWSGITSVTIVGGPRLVDADTVEVTLDFAFDGKHSRERHHLDMIESDGKMLINRDSGPL
ncbi:serine/threonine-protein kinase [Amycolatopsis thermophila]|uniref:non-specific serine/threonine protein kinase n=1 Tax=Amycolatopsis thermophila TaxID=206084 RepID=A0ABU0EX56_9PSEU|nr:serine/threonine-protein kinase [Amycolatopsis thermophila]MDQ0379536.1 serine/threonine protein kinase [Amycolatopsis thermophila]